MFATAWLFLVLGFLVGVTVLLLTNFEVPLNKTLPPTQPKIPLIRLYGDPGSLQGAFEALADGIRLVEGSQLKVQTVYNYQYQPSDLAVTWSDVRLTNSDAKFRLKTILKRDYHNRLLVVDNPIINRRLNSPTSLAKPTGSAYVRLGVNSFLYDEGNFNNTATVSPQRWLKLCRDNKITVQPWRSLTPDGHILILLQKLFDASLRGREEDRPRRHLAWVQAVINEIRAQKCERPIIVRAHPLSFTNTQERQWLQQFKPKDSACRLVIDSSPLPEWLVNCHVGITFTSGSCYDLLLNGIPCLTYDSGSMAWPVTEHDCTHIHQPLLFNREPWFHALAYCEWSVAELRTGEPWLHLKSCLPTLKKKN